MRGSYINRLLENHPNDSVIEVGTLVTEYLYTDRHVYEVVEVDSPKRVTIRRMRALPKEGSVPMSNQWELVSDKDGIERKLTKRGKYWYWTSEVTKDMYDERKDDVRFMIAFLGAGFDKDKMERDGKSQARYRRAKVRFGVGDYYYDYEF